MPSAVAQLVVVGSVNTDLMLRVPRQPRAGETLSGHGFTVQPGGKGANQAVAAARLGANTALIGCVGEDDFGNQAIAALTHGGVDVRHVCRIADRPTGVALIMTDDDGENCIALDSGANAMLGSTQVAAAEALIANASLLLCQLEVPSQAVTTALALARANGVPTALNPSPFAPVARSLIAGLEFVIPNRIEASELTGIRIDDMDSAVAAARSLHALGAAQVLLTLGADGVLWCNGGDCEHLPAQPVQVVDTTGAGDTFAGAFAAARLRGATVRESIQFGQRAAGHSVQRRGAQPSMPRLEDLGQN